MKECPRKHHQRDRRSPRFAFSIGPPKKGLFIKKRVAAKKERENAFYLFFRVHVEGNLAFFNQADHSDFST